MLKFVMILLMVITLQADNLKVLLTGVALHSDNADIFGTTFNTFVPGLGLRYEHDYSNNVTVSVTGTWMSDSYSNNMLTLTVGGYYKLWSANGYVVKGGIEVGAVNKKMQTISYHIEKTPVSYVSNRKVYKIYDKEVVLDQTWAYETVFALTPVITVEKGNFSLNFTYVPPVQVNNIKSTDLMLITIGYKFYNF